MSDAPTPIQQGIEHGPYAPDSGEPNEAFNQARGLRRAVVDAYDNGLINGEEAIEGRKAVGAFAMNGIAYGREDEIAAQKGDDASEEDMDRFFIAQEIELGVYDDLHAVHDVWDNHNDELNSQIDEHDNDDEDTEDPLAGDVDKFVHPDETRSDEQIARDEDLANRQHMSGADDSDAYWEDYEELYGDQGGGVTTSEFEKEPKNQYVITLERTIKERALAQGLNEDEAAKIDAAHFTLKDADGKPTDILKVSITHYKGMYSRPGVEGFDLRPIDGPKDSYGRDAKFVTGSFWGSLQSPNEGAFSMSYGFPGGDARQYAHNAMQEASLANADVHLHLPEQQEN